MIKNKKTEFQERTRADGREREKTSAKEFKKWNEKKIESERERENQQRTQEAAKCADLPRKQHQHIIMDFTRIARQQQLCYLRVNDEKQEEWTNENAAKNSNANEDAKRRDCWMRSRKKMLIEWTNEWWRRRRWCIRYKYIIIGSCRVESYALTKIAFF